MFLVYLFINHLLELFDNHVALETPDHLEFESFVLPPASELLHFLLLRMVGVESDKALI